MITSVQFKFDSLYTYGMANALYVPTVDKAVTTILAGLQTMLAATTEVQWIHEDAHAGNPLMNSLIRRRKRS